MGEDYWGAMLEFESILAEYPLDPYSLHMAYFLALTIGNSRPDAIELRVLWSLSRLVILVDLFWDPSGQETPLNRIRKPLWYGN